jgi:deoxyribodipyrimidine photo-lyase
MDLEPIDDPRGRGAPMTFPLNIVWFKRDLRIVDHWPLARALEAGSVLPLYIVEPKLWAQPDASGRQWEFAAESLKELQDALAALGQPLCVMVGDAVQILSQLHAACPPSAPMRQIEGSR